jgi:hypothetical protein
MRRLSTRRSRWATAGSRRPQSRTAELAPHGDTRRGLGLLGAGASTGFAALAIGMGAGAPGFPRALVRHPAPVMLTATAVLAWIGAL